MPNARPPRMCVTVLASQPSVSIDTETTQRTAAKLALRPTVFITSRNRSASSIVSVLREVALAYLLFERIDFVVGRFAVSVR